MTSKCRNGSDRFGICFISPDIGSIQVQVGFEPSHSALERSLRLPIDGLARPGSERHEGPVRMQNGRPVLFWRWWNLDCLLIWQRQPLLVRSTVQTIEDGTQHFQLSPNLVKAQ